MNKYQTNKKKILFALPGLHVGGIERHLLKQFTHFDQDKYELHLLTFFYIKGSPDLFDQVPPFVQVHRFNFSYGFDIKNTLRLIKFLRELKPDLVVSSMVFPNTIMRLLKPFVGYKVIAREHSTYLDKTFRHKLRDHICSYFSDMIVAVSNTVAEYAANQAKIPIRKFTVIQNGVDLGEIEQFKISSAAKVKQLYKEFGLPSKTKIVLSVGRVKKIKNHPLLIDAFAKFSKQHPEYVLFIIGGGVEAQNVQHKVLNMGLKQKVILTGYRTDVFTFYAASDFFILTSDIEGFPNVAVEAMAFSLPVLSTNVAGIDELIENGVNGFLLEREPASVCDTMVGVAEIKNVVLKAMKRAAFDTAQKYSIQENVRKYERLFDSTISK